MATGSGRVDGRSRRPTDEGETDMVEIRGSVEPGFEQVRDAFAGNFERHGDVGAAVTVYVDGRPVVDLTGGVTTSGTPYDDDTLQLARRKHPAGPNSLDALCKRYGIDNSKRIKHGALMDSLLLAEVYLELLGERQASLILGSERGGGATRDSRGVAIAVRGPRPVPLPVRVTEEQIAAHRAFVETLGPKALWKRYLSPDEAT